MTLLLEFQAATLARALNDTEAAPGVAGFLDGCDLCLTKTEIDIEPDTTLAALDAEEADYSGYARQALVWGVPSVSDDGTVEVIAAPLTFRPTAATVGNQIYAVYIVDGGGTLLYFARQLDEAPVPMVSTLDVLILTIRYRPATDTICIAIT